MTTDKDRELIKDICGCINIPIGISILNQNVVSAVFKSNAVGDIEQNELLDIISRIRSESADQARKEAAERAVAFIRTLNSESMDLWSEYEDNGLRAAILGDSVVKENLITDHIPDTGEKLAIAVKALEDIKEMRWGDSWKVARDALREIQG